VCASTVQYSVSVIGAFYIGSRVVLPVLFPLIRLGAGEEGEAGRSNYGIAAAGVSLWQGLFHQSPLLCFASPLILKKKKEKEANHT
ncbi:hypothetical protein BHM03_00032710, partial [Ensete ventricosum]